MITIALAVDEDVRWSVIVPKSEEDVIPLSRLRIASGPVVGGVGTVSLKSDVVIDLAKQPDRMQTIQLLKGVYLITTGASLRFEKLKQVRVYINGGKDPWPPPPPPAPQGTDLSMHREVYEQGFDNVLIQAGGGSAWIEVKSLELPVAAAPVEDKRG